MAEADNPTYPGGYGDGMWAAATLLAAAYSEHPDYQQKWDI